MHRSTVLLLVGVRVLRRQVNQSLLDDLSFIDCRSYKRRSVRDMSLESSHATLTTLVLWACLSFSLASERPLAESTTTVLLPMKYFKSRSVFQCFVHKSNVRREAQR